MFEKKLYVCEYCNTSYSSEEKAKECEENHRIGMKIIWADYVAMKSDKTGMPKTIRVQFQDGITGLYKKY